MSQAAQRILEDFEALPESDQRSVVAEILQRSAELMENLPFTEEEWAEIERRQAEHDQNPGSAIPWEEVRERLYRRFA